jgi:bacterioferritin-associated ferredoxin
LDEALTIVCRCSDVTLQQVRDLVSEGYVTVDEVKRLLRIGMGPCQGRTCGGILQQEIARITKTPLGQVLPGRYRPPSRAIKLGTIADNREEDTP